MNPVTPSRSAPPAPVDPPPAGDPATPPAADSRGAARRQERLLEARLLRLENYLGFRPLGESDAEIILAGGTPEAAAAPLVPDEVVIERQIGEFWLARIGVVALVIGLGLLVAYPFAGLPAGSASAIGFAAGAVAFWLARRWQDALPELARLLFPGAILLCYLATVRLHFFAPRPLVAERLPAVLLQALVVAVALGVAHRHRSEFVAILVSVLGFITAILGDRLPVSLSLMAGLAAAAVWFVHRHRWHWNHAVVMLLAYGLHLLLLLNNPLAGHPLRALAAPQGHLGFLALNTAILAAVGFLPGASGLAVGWRVVRPLVISWGVLVIAALDGFIFKQGQSPWVELGVAGGLLALAVAGWRHHASRYATSIQVCAAFIALSVFLIRFFPAPACFAWLAWQSLLVAAVAVAFRSKIIVVANVLIFAAIYAVYLFIAPDSGPVNLSFALVALLTARLLNWQNQRLELRTELMRNFYLLAAVVAVPYGLYHTVPAGWVSTSWLAVAAAYFGVSRWLRNRKYRWMAIGTVFATVVYVFVFDLARLAPAYRIVSFLVLGVGLLVISVFYTRDRRRQEETATPPS